MKQSPIIFMVAALAALSPFPNKGRGIGFDDLSFAPTLRKVLVPGGGMGSLALIDPDSQKVETIEGFSERTRYAGGHGSGLTSADAGRGLIYVTDRTSKLLDVLDGQTKEIVASAQLASGPDYVRFVPDNNEVWVTEPGAERIEIFTLPERATIAPTNTGFIAVPGGPESLIVGRRRAFTHLWSGKTLAIDLRSHKVVGRWSNGCKGSRGIALDEKRGFLFAGCNEGKLSVLDLNSGRRLGEASSGSGIDVIAYNQRLAHVYLPGTNSGTLAVVGISSNGVAKVIKTIGTVVGAHCATVDDRDQVYVCDPAHGKILVFKDSPSDSQRK